VRSKVASEASAGTAASAKAVAARRRCFIVCLSWFSVARYQRSVASLSVSAAKARRQHPFAALPSYAPRDALVPQK